MRVPPKNPPSEYLYTKNYFETDIILMPQINLETKEWEYSTQKFCIGPIKNRKQATNSF